MFDFSIENHIEMASVEMFNSEVELQKR